jgi:hypothetical protein
MDDWLIYLRLSEFAADDDEGTFEVRADELRGLADEIGVNVPPDGVRIENDVDEATGRVRGASASKARDRVLAANGLAELRTRRPEYLGVLLDLQQGVARGVIVSDESRLARDWRDGMALLDACKLGGAGCVAMGSDGSARWVLSPGGGTKDERSRLLDRVNDARRGAEDLGARIAKGRRRWAGRSWHGGPRPWGYRIVEGTTEHARNLEPDDAEAAVANATADALLDGASVKACVRDLRERALTGEPGTATASGTPWSTRSLIGALIKPATAGLQVKGDTWVKAPWPAIIEREKWDRLRALLLDPARRTNTSHANEPKWLVSVWARCGVCGGLLRVGGAGQGRGPAYVGQDCGHIRRDAHKVDAVIEEAVLGVLERPGMVERLRPPPRPRNGTDRAALAAELDTLAARRDDYQDRAAAGRIDPDDLEGILTGIRAREQVIRQRLAATAELPDVLAAFRLRPARTVWAELDMSRRRAVVQRVYASVTINRAGRGGRFDPALIDAEPRGDVTA